MFHKVLEKLEKKMYVKDPTLSSDEYKKGEEKTCIYLCPHKISLFNFYSFFLSSPNYMKYLCNLNYM